MLNRVNRYTNNDQDTTTKEMAALLLLHPDRIQYRTGASKKKLIAYVRAYLATVSDPAEKIAYQQYIKKQITTDEEENLLWKFIKGFMLFFETLEEHKVIVNNAVIIHFIEKSIVGIRDIPIMLKFGDDVVDIQTMKLLLMNRSAEKMLQRRIVTKKYNDNSIAV